MNSLSNEQKFSRIWSVVCDIPPGKVASYGQVAGMAGLPRGARQVGRALGKVPPGQSVPWHRVLRSSGQLAFAAGSEEYRQQVALLARENVDASAGRVDMKKYRWQPDLDELLWKPSASWDER